MNAEAPETPVSPRERGRRCSATTKAGLKCSNPSMVGLTVCRSHGGAQRTAVEKSEKAKVVKDLADHARPIAYDDLRANPINALLDEQRWTLGRIDYLRSRIGELEQEELTWERVAVEIEQIGASDTPGRNKKVRWESRVNTLLELEARERKHLMEISRLMLAVGFESAKMQMHAGLKTATVDLILDAVSRLGIDPEAEGTKAAIRGALSAKATFSVPALVT